MESPEATLVLLKRKLLALDLGDSMGDYFFSSSISSCPPVLFFLIGIAALLTVYLASLLIAEAFSESE